ncbi:MAG: fasciclin domain-containing protein [Flavobacteriaceae bacterium]|nr:fasciclin domain-containing protein [Flavobacteriaceae bacterium]
MKNQIKFSNLFAILVLFIALACQNDKKAVDEKKSSSESSAESNKGQAFIEDESAIPNILKIAIGSSDHSTLVAAVQAAELENVLVNAGPLTVFAPTNEAFNNLPKGTVEDLLKPENKNALANIIKYHATPGNLSVDFLKKFKKLGQANNQDVSVEVIDGEVYVGGAKIIGSVPASNGIVHVVDKVLLPPSK